ncbi:MAG TPA: hypothetical protein VF322_08420 [Gammaproteobacteria bacterium]
MSAAASNAGPLAAGRPGDGAPAAGHDGGGVAAAGGAVLGAARDAVRHVADLAAAEVRLAALSGAAILACALLAGASLILAWGLVVILAIDGLQRLGLPWQATAAGLAVVHVVVAFLLVRGAVGLSRNLGLPRLRQTLLARSERA